jgi:phosphinothricin acetyltransferase
VRPATADDAAAIAGIYGHYVRETAVSFETEPPCVEEMRGRIEAGGDRFAWLAGVDEEDGTLLGYAYAAPFRTRAAYRFAVETTVYLRNGLAGRGLGGRLYRPLIASLEVQGYTQAIAAITLPKEPSARPHERLGFLRTGTYAKVGWKLGRWLDVGLWQRPLAAVTDRPEEPRRLADIGPAGL